MNIRLLLLASLTSAITPPPPFLDLNANVSLPPPQLGVQYRCATPSERKLDTQVPSALDCLNLMTFILATTPDHDKLMTWTRTPQAGEVMLPYQRDTGSCLLWVQLARANPQPKFERATFDEMIAAALRVLEICMLEYVPGAVKLGGLAQTGSSGDLLVMIAGTKGIRDGDGESRNETSILNPSEAGVDRLLQS